MAASGSSGSKQPKFTNAVGICYNHRDDNLYIADKSYNSIQVLTTELRYVRTIATELGLTERIKNFMVQCQEVWFSKNEYCMSDECNCYKSSKNEYCMSDECNYCRSNCKNEYSVQANL